MGIERVGYRRLYDSVSCSLVEREELLIEFPVDNLNIRVYLGSKPKLGIKIVDHTDKYIVPNAVSNLGTFTLQKDATKLNYPHSFFTEILCSIQIEVSQELSKAFHAKDPTALKELQRLAEQNKKSLKAATDLIAGTVGLRFHRQFVQEAIDENFFAIMSDDNFSVSYTGPSLECLEKVRLNPNGTQNLRQLLQTIGQATPEAREFSASALAWLLRAWAENNIISKFIALFIPIEIILEGYKGNMDNDKEKQEKASKIRNLLVIHGGTEANSFLTFFDQIMEQRRPTLVSRFEGMAKKARIVGWESDVIAFKRFNSIRNKLLHKGEQEVQLVIPMDDELEETNRQLEDIAERYVSWALFKDGVVYPSKWRTQRTKKVEQ